MGCISSKPSNTNHQQPKVHVIIPNPYSLSSTTNHTIDHVLENLIPPKHDDHTLIIHTNTNLKTDDTLERCSSFHTVEEYDEMLQQIRNHSDDAETTDSTCKNETKDKEKHDMEFQTVASLRQWLHAPGDADVATIDYTTLRAGFSFYENNNIQGAEEEEESIAELVAAFDKYMQQLQIDEDNIIKQIHNMID